ncbi:DNA recombination protein RmuC [Rhizobium laguerreae]|uniref:DNA recombination protein RmuC n=1 Tax=Rhizobium laguerreae TaxID=1076926 RepID=UPI00143F3A60|nr:DNA recombination protein RmuC [Rhizobium laguerreae]MBY3397360.1 DNA recombination protein RmuC [Rhizobium laguerreae]MBY3417219.1 DNA recombination protein RmuC [Rhizobium laguerreae]MBY3503195.1 DNA recombination protein RmuC [Rhizobium laguerreae]MBY3522813.1 DNA recombination protein RmuC [Rhizobium laguerreae]MBY3569388.1 DNA recombination protein RmuC [Rhizobium laguerreae]
MLVDQEYIQWSLWGAAAFSSFVSLLVVFVVISRLSRLAGKLDADPAAAKLNALEMAQERIERNVRDDLRAAREEGTASAKDLREEVTKSIAALAETLRTQSAEAAKQQKENLDQVSQTLRQMASDSAAQFSKNQEALLTTFRELRDQVIQNLDAMKADAGERTKALTETVTASLDRFAKNSIEQNQQMFDIQRAQHEDFGKRLEVLSEKNAQTGEALKLSVENQLGVLRKENGEKLEQMRVTVDEKLQGTLDKRLGDSFKIVSERLEAVHQGLGEMQNLATGVGDLKRVLTNVKSRGSWGEVQLGALLEQILTPAQYVANATMSEFGNERVEYAIRLPGSGETEECLLPIDAKFPIEDYERLQAASEIGDIAAVEEASKALETRIKNSAKDISSKYIRPPKTTDFAILFLPTEGLYAEIIRRPGLCDDLQRTYRVTVAGPTTLTAILSSLQMGFRTLAIQERSSEVWQVLSAVKEEFGKFGPVLEKVKKKLQEASNQIDNVEVRGRAINRKLRNVEILPANDAQVLIETLEEDLGFDDDDAEADGKLSA